jgi:uncharacterized protein YaaN involved in tellurite resistance
MNDPQAQPEPSDLAQAVLDPEEMARADEIARRFDPRQGHAILQFGVAAQKRRGDLVNSILRKVRTRDAGPAGEALAMLMTRVRETRADNVAGKAHRLLARLPLVGPLFHQFRRLLSQYEKVELKIDRIVDELKQSRQTLLADIMQFDLLHAENAADFRDTLVFIRAGENKLEELREEQLAAQAQAAGGSSLAAAQQARELADLMTRLERRIHDLKLTAMIALQMAPQIRLVQASDQTLVEKIQNSILTTIPLWRNQVALAVSLLHQKQALELQRAVTDASNELLAGNARLLQQGVTGIARESERGIVELSTLQEVNDRLIATIHDTLRIQDEGRRMRREAEGQLQGLQLRLRDALANIQPPRLPASVDL